MIFLWTNSTWNYCGITEKEIHDNMEEDLYILADKQKMTYEEVCTELKECYDGYHFVEDSIGIYNPFSLLNTFYKMKFGSYWFETGTPTYLVELLKKSNYNLQHITHEETDADVLNSIDSTSRNPIPVIYQSGYLTIKGFDNRFGIYRLGFPNREVEEGFIKYLLPFYTNIDVIESPFQIRQFVDEVEHGDCNAFFRRLQSFFADKTSLRKEPIADLDKGFVEKLRALIDEQLGNSELSVEDLGDKIGMSRVQLYRKSKALTGYSPNELLRIARLKKSYFTACIYRKDHCRDYL